MSQDNLSNQAAEAADSFTQMLKPVEAAAESTCQTFRKEADHMISCASDKIRSNPLPAVAGAFAFGIAIGCLIMSGRQSMEHHALDDLRQPLADAGDSLTSALRGVYDNLKFW
ncbi:MAG: hypothetical protein V4689_18075 [Verrucomicrobiota bacterium]